MKKEFKDFLINFQGLLSKLTEGARKTLWILARNAFSFTLALVFLAMAFGGFLFYNYIFLTESKEPDISSNITKFREDAYNALTQEWENREKIFNSPPETNYQNPFY